MFRFKSLRNKLIFGCIILSIIPILIITGVLYRKSAHIIEKNTAEAVISNLEKYADKIDDIFLDAYYKTVNLTYNEKLNKLLKGAKGEEGYLKISEYLTDYVNENKPIDLIYIYLPKDKKLITSDRAGRIIKLASLDNALYKYKKSFKNSWILVDEIKENITSMNNNYFSIEKDIINSKTNEVLAKLIVNVDEKAIFFNVLNEMKIRKNDKIIMINSDNIIVSCEKSSDIGNKFENMSAKNFFINNKGYSLRKINGQTILEAFAVTKSTKYKIIYQIPQKEIIYDINDITKLVIISVVINIIVIIALWYFFTIDLYKPIVKLKEVMKEVGEGKFDIEIENNRKDELGILINGFNKMIQKINNLFNQVFINKYLKKEAELKALQSQITPHFLYNTLNSIRCVAILQNSKIVSNMLGALIELLQATVGNKHIFVSLKEEIKQVDNYVKLQKFRYNDAFEVIYKIDKDKENYKVPKLILQPLVENSLQHGLDLRNKEGRIIIRVEQKEEKLFLIVEDNGRGMTKKKANEIFTNEIEKNRKFSGIGVKNIDERIKLYFGEEYGLKYKTEKKEGTTAIICLPVIKKGEEKYVEGVNS